MKFTEIFPPWEQTKDVIYIISDEAYDSKLFKEMV